MTTVERIFSLLNEHGMTAKDLSKAVGLSGGNITDWKTGRSKPSVQSLMKIADYFNVSIDYLLGNSDTPSYTEKLTDYLKSLNLTDKQFALFKKVATSYINKDTPEDIAEILISSGLAQEDLDKIFIALDFFSNVAESFEKTVKLNKVSHLASKALNNLFDNKSKNSYEDFIENAQSSIVVRDGLIDALNNLNQSMIVSYKVPKTSQFYMCPVYGQISAGQPNWAEECIEGRIPIDYELMNIANPEEHFFLRVNGESMNKIVKNGAYALIHKQDTVENGEIAVVLVNGYDATLKKFTQNENVVVLEPMSDDSSFQTQIYNENTDIKILGKYVGKFEMNK